MAGLMRFLRREPLVHFLALAVLLFALDYFSSSTEKETIYISQKTIDSLVEQREEIVLRRLTLEQREELIEQYIDDEVLYREAYKLGLDKNARMRRNLIRLMRGLEMSKVGEPTKEDLQRYFESNREIYARPPSLTLKRVYFQDASEVPDKLLSQLRSGLDVDSMADRMPAARTSVEKAAQLKLVALLGPETARAVLAIEDDDWHGPYKTRRGVHFVRVVERHSAEPLQYEEIAHFLQSDWQQAKARQAVEAESKQLRENYNIVIEREESGQ